MFSYDRTSQALAVGLALLAGFIDALGFISLGGFFVSFMSGNSTRFAVGFSEHADWKIVLLPLVLITLFVSGVILGKIIRHYKNARPSTSILTFMSCTLACACLLFELDLHTVAISLMVMAMGAANNVFVREGEVSIGVTYMTGTLVKLGQRLAGKLLGEKDSSWLPYLLLWAGLISGAIGGSFAYIHWQFHSLWAGLAICLALTVLSFRIEQKS